MDIFDGILVDFILFSFIESFIYCLYFEKIWKCDKFKLYEIIIIGIINSIISKMFPQLLYQLLIMTAMGCYIYMIKNKPMLKCIIISASAILFLLVVETLFMMGISFITNIKIDTLCNIEIFFIIFPCKVLEIILIMGGESMKTWWAEIEKRK